MSPATGQKIVVSALYHFVRLDNYQALQQPLLDFMLKNEISRQRKHMKDVQREKNRRSSQVHR